MLVDHFLAAVNVTLISWWKALLIIPPFILSLIHI